MFQTTINQRIKNETGNPVSTFHIIVQRLLRCDGVPIDDTVQLN